jgi:ricin-type beta-trefoil lectin protein/alpha galactosidase A-like protein/alpha galactosidase C-like protein
MLKRVLTAAVLLASSLSIPVLAAGPAQAVDNGVADVPPQGWNNWSVMQRDPTEAKVKAQAKALKDSGLLSHGYVYANIDDFWYLNPGTDVDQYGRWVTDPARFPKGMADMGAYVHGLGEKFGLYLTPGIPKAAYDRNTPIEGTSFHARDIVSNTSTAEKNYRHLGNVMYFIDYDKNPAAAQAYLNSWANQMASWGVDYLKMDGVGSADKADVTHWATALAQTGRKIFFGLSNNLGTTDIATWQASANAWRISGDVDCCQPEHQTTWALVSSRFTQAPKWAPYAGKGGWNDFDSLQIGDGDKVGINAEERKSGMSLWAISAASLLVGTDLTTLTAGDLALMTNDEIIAVDRAGIPATPVSQASDQQVWRSRNPDGSYTVAFFNLGGSSATVKSDFAADLGFTGTASIRDLWQRKDVGTTNGSLSRTVPSHGSFVFRVVPDAGATFLGGTLVSAKSGRCVDVPRGRTVNATQLEVWDCNGGTNQKISYNASAKTLKVLGKCFDAHGKATANGTHVELNDCNGGTNQQWNVNSNGTITGVQSGSCLDVTGATNPNGAGLELWNCNGGTNQKWTLGTGVRQ